jgi:hypothetical protein
MFRKVIAAVIVAGSMSQVAKAEQLEYCEPIYSGSDSAYVPCVSSVDLGNGESVVYNNEGVVVHRSTVGRAASGTNNACFAYNRDGRTCQGVGFGEGQVGYPWGGHAGKFQCTDGCLKWIGN